MMGQLSHYTAPFYVIQYDRNIFIYIYICMQAYYVDCIRPLIELSSFCFFCFFFFLVCDDSAMQNNVMR